MAILKLKSTNENFSHVISKNPASGMIAKGLRQGVSFGWFGDNETYLIFFKDSMNEVSYSKNDKEQFEYNDLSRYNSPVFVLNVITEYLSSAFKKEHELDLDGFENEIEMNLEVDRLPLIKNMFYRAPDITVSYEELGGNNYKVKVKTTKSINYLLNFVNVYCLFVAIIDDYYMNMTSEMILKYVKALNVINATYYMRYLFQLKVIVSKKMFDMVKDELENYEENKLELMFGNTAEWRREFIFKHLDYSRDIIDLGCGEGFYTLPLAKKLKNNVVHAIDIDEELIRTVERKAESRGHDNVITYDSIYSYGKLNETEEEVDIILSEVIEHMPKEDSLDIIKEVLRFNFNQLFISTPTKEFNVHYDLDNSIDEKRKNGFRHDDHKWEGTVEEFTELIDKAIEDVNKETGKQFVYSHYMVGDKVDGIAPTQSVIVKELK